ncbi:MAG: hypothetical protein LBD25_08050 [Coriobacteriales bacterium]|jgi:hypothetical protein|nr:hypothetical protein [Coriobacteriales bacterium]
MAGRNLVRKTAPPQQRSSGKGAIGVGITTLITILVVMLLAVFSVLSLSTARSDLRLAQMSAQAASDYYEADGRAQTWRARLVSTVIVTPPAERGERLAKAGYAVTDGGPGVLLVTGSFAIDELRDLVVTIAVGTDGSCMVRQWQTVSS